ncbi:hypothetical protein AC249_AIPGENE22009, partial [Exaiptasia diaphana]
VKKIKDPKKVAAGKRLAEYHKKAKNALQKEKKQKSWMPEISLTTAISIVGTTIAAVDLYYRWKSSKSGLRTHMTNLWKSKPEEKPEEIEEIEVEEPKKRPKRKIGSMYIAKYFDKQHADKERIRHDKAMEEYEKEMGAWRKRRQEYQDWLESEYLKKKQADENLNSTDQALSLYKRAHPDFDLEEPEFHYTPSASQKRYEIAYVAGGMGL